MCEDKFVLKFVHVSVKEFESLRAPTVLLVRCRCLELEMHECSGVLKANFFKFFRQKKLVPSTTWQQTRLKQISKQASNFFLELETKIKKNCGFLASTKTRRYAGIFVQCVLFKAC